MNSSKKYIKFFSDGYYFPSYISPFRHNIINIRNGCIASIVILYLMTQVPASICKHLQLSIANLASLVNISTPVLKKISFEWSWQLPVFSVSCAFCWSTGLTEKNLFMQMNARAEIHTNGALEIKSVESFLVTGKKVAEQDFYYLTKICQNSRNSKCLSFCGFMLSVYCSDVSRPLNGVKSQTFIPN